MRFALANKAAVPHGWAPRILIQCGVPFTDVWDVFHEMYESQVQSLCILVISLANILKNAQVPPFNDQANVQALSSDIAVLLLDWLEEAKRPQLYSGGQGEFPVSRIDLAVDQYLSELEGSRAETKVMYESIKRQLRQNW